MAKKTKDKAKTKNVGGRPPIWATPEELQKVIDKYFRECENNKSPFLTKEGNIIKIPNPLIPTIAGLAYHLGVDRQTIYNYKGKDGFFDTIKKARDFILSRIEGKLTNASGNVTGAIFIAKNYGYQDKQELEHSGTVNFNVNPKIGKPKDVNND